MMSLSAFRAKELPIIGQYGIQRFKQFGPEDSANFYIVQGSNTKKPSSMYPVLGRKHISYNGVNSLIFNAEPRAIFRSINYWYAVVGNTIYRVDKNFNKVDISQGLIVSSGGNIFFTYLVVNSITFACFVDGEKIYIYQEGTGILQVVTDPNAPGNIIVDGERTKPGYIAAFGNRIAVSVAESSQFYLSAVNLLTSGAFDPATCFTTASQAVFAQEAGIIGQMGVLNNTLYIFCDFTTGVWSNNPTVFPGTGVSFPWKKNTTYDWNFGIADPNSLDINFGRLAFLGQNANGLLQAMASDGGSPKRISSKAIDVLFQKYSNAFPNGGPFLGGNADGFLYQYENTIFYRLSAGPYNNFGLLDLEDSANSIEYNFEADEWHRCIELNGERSRINRHIFFGNRHLVTVSGQRTVYELSAFYSNEIQSPIFDDNEQSLDAYIAYPMRYERVTPIISEDDYSEFETEYVQIDFVFGESNINFSESPFENAQFIIDEEPSITGEPVYLVTDDDSSAGPTYIIAEGTNTPSIHENTYNQVFKPHIELYWSDDGGINFHPADVMQFSQMGAYQWRMRWYQLGCSRNRVYKLICVSPVPVVVLGGAMNVRRVSGGGN